MIHEKKQPQIKENISNNNDLEIPKAMREKKKSSLDTPMTSSTKTNDILNQINQYLEKEKNT